MGIFVYGWLHDAARVPGSHTSTCQLLSTSTASAVASMPVLAHEIRCFDAGQAVGLAVGFIKE
jgi:hypothetical protein